MNISTCFHLPHEYIIVFTFVFRWAHRLTFGLKCCRDINCCIVTIIVSGRSGSFWSFCSTVINRGIRYVLVRLSWDNTQGEMVIPQSWTYVRHDLFCFYIQCYCNQHVLLMWLLVMTSCGWNKQLHSFFYNRGLALMFAVCKSNEAAPLTGLSWKHKNAPMSHEKLELITMEICALQK